MRVLTLRYVVLAIVLTAAHSGWGQASAGPMKNVLPDFDIRDSEPAGPLGTAVNSPQSLAATGTAPLTIGTPPALPLALYGSSYSFAFSASGGVPPLTWSVASGALPNGLVLSTGGVLNGAPVQYGAF